MFNRRIVVILASLLLLLAGSAVADTTLTFTGVGGNQAGGEYTYPYFFTVSDSNGVHNNVALLCDSFDNNVFVGESWSVNETNITNGSFLSPVVLGITQQTAYRAAGLLYSQLGDNPSASTANSINYAIWGLFSQNARDNAAFLGTGANFLEEQAITGALVGDTGQYMGVTLYTPVGGNVQGAPQEFIGFTSVPEPASMTFLGTVLLAAIGRRKLMV